MNYSNLLIPAVHTKRLDILKAAVGTAVFHMPKHDFINDADSRGITALALASLTWLHEEDPKAKAELNAMVAFLLDFKANPYQEIGCVFRKRYAGWHGRKEFIREPGKTIAELCNGKLPPALDLFIRRDAKRHQVNVGRLTERRAA
ncbi:hypothetical protein ACSMEA_05860 [Stenotrophomonas maltophilia]